MMDNDKYIGRLLDGRYEILEVIGTGGMAVVYKARCHRLNRLVAVKILKDEHVQDEEFRRRFRAEGEAVGMLSHPNIVSVYDVSSADHAEFIVMELIDGITLKQYMEKRGYLNWKETLHFAIQIAKALEHAHSRGLVHRDIKPHNVMVLKNGSIKVADFGIARVMSKSNTLTKEALGSVHYISPEQAKGGRVDSRSDIYSLGVVMYEMIAGRVPYDGESPVGVAIQHINGGAVKPSRINPGTPEGLENIIMKAMALEPENRYATATAMLYEMDEFRKNPEAIPVPVVSTDSHTQVLPVKQTQNAEPKPQTIAERTAVKKTPDIERAAPRPPRPKQPVQSHPNNSNRTATIAIISCAGVALIGLIIFLVLLAQGGLFGKETMITVPNLLGQYYDPLQQYSGIEIKHQGSENSDQYAKGQIMYQYPPAGDEVVEGTKVFIKVSLGKEVASKVMGNFIGEDAEKVEGFLNGQGITNVVKVERHNDKFAAGVVFKTEPAAGEELNESEPVKIYVSLGTEAPSAPEKAEVPYVVGKTYEQAVKKLNANGFFNIRPNPVDSDEEKDVVVAQSVERYEKVDVTTPIVLDVSTGVSELPTEPDPTDPDVTDPTNPTEPDVTDPTDPDVTDPTDPDVTDPTEPSDELQQKEVYFEIPVSSESYRLTIKVGDEIFLDNMSIAPGAAGVTLPVVGSGTVVYDFYYNDVYIKSETVDFDPDE